MFPFVSDGPFDLIWAIVASSRASRSGCLRLGNLDLDIFARLHLYDFFQQVPVVVADLKRVQVCLFLL